MSQHRREIGICIGCLLSAALLTGCPWRFEEPKLSSSIRRAPICAGAANAEEQRAIDELATALRESASGMLCWRGYWSAFPDRAAAAFDASGVSPKFNRDGRFLVVHPSVAVTIYEWNADSTVLVPALYSEAPAGLNPCPDGLSWSGRWGYWRNDGRVEVVVNCGDPASLGPFPRLVFDPATQEWAVDTQAGSVRTSDYADDPPVNLVVEGKVTGRDGSRYPVAFDYVYRLTARYALSAEGFRVQNFKTGAIFEFAHLPFINPSGTRLAVDDRDAGVVRVYDLSGDEPIELLDVETPSEWVQLDGFPGDRILVASAKQQYETLYLPAAYDFALLIDSEIGSIFDIRKDKIGSFSGLFSTRTEVHEASP